MFLGTAVLGLAAWPHLPRGICTGDAGDLQLAATVLGIPHPPGYAAYVSLAHLATWVPGIEPAFAVTLFCLASGLATLIVVAGLGMRLGGDAWACSAVAMALSAPTRVWLNLTTPEVYMLSAALVMLAIYQMVRFAEQGRKRNLAFAVLLFAIATANRPPIVLAAPFFLAAWWHAERRRMTPLRNRLRTLAWITSVATLPMLYSLGYLYVRDTPSTPYNYLDEHNAEAGELPESHDGFLAKAKRVAWLATAAQFRDHVGNSWPKVRAKFRWVRHELRGDGLVETLAAGALVLVGVGVTARRSAVAAWCLGGVALQSVLFVLIYKDHGQAADLMPLILAAGVFAAAGLGRLLPSRGTGLRRWLAPAIFVLTAWYTVSDAPHRPRYGASRDGEGFLQNADFATFPADSVFISTWNQSIPALYEVVVRRPRKDVEVVIAQPSNWLRMAAKFPGRPIFVIHKLQALQQSHALTAYRNVWRLGPQKPPV